MKVEYHPAVEQDVAEIKERYRSASPKLAAEFESELRRVVAVAADNPKRFHPLKEGIRRANLIGFPYHVIYREFPDHIRITLVRHHRRNPSLGLKRQ